MLYFIWMDELPRDPEVLKKINVKDSFGLPNSKIVTKVAEDTFIRLI